MSYHYIAIPQLRELFDCPSYNTRSQDTVLTQSRTEHFAVMNSGMLSRWVLLAPRLGSGKTAHNLASGVHTDSEQLGDHRIDANIAANTETRPNLL